MKRPVPGTMMSRRSWPKAGALKNYSPNLGYDWGGRLTAAWLDR